MTKISNSKTLYVYWQTISIAW